MRSVFGLLDVRLVHDHDARPVGEIRPFEPRTGDGVAVGGAGVVAEPTDDVGAVFATGEHQRREEDAARGATPINPKRVQAGQGNTDQNFQKPVAEMSPPLLCPASMAHHTTGYAAGQPVYFTHAGYF